MRKVITVVLLVITLLIGGMTMDAKTTRKKAKTKTTQSSSSKWNGDIPSATFIANTFFFGYDHPNNENILKEHGYRYTTREFKDDYYVKDGVCEIGVQHFAQAIEIYIVVYDSALRNWLYNDIQRYVKSKGKHSGFSVSMYGNEITFILGRYGY